MPWPREWRMVVAFSGVRAEKTREALEKYNMASRRVRDSVTRFNQLAGTHLATLREVVDYEPKPGGAAWLKELERAPARAAGDQPRALPTACGSSSSRTGSTSPGPSPHFRLGTCEAFGRLVSASHLASQGIPLEHRARDRLPPGNGLQARSRRGIRIRRWVRREHLRRHHRRSRGRAPGQVAQAVRGTLPGPGRRVGVLHRRTRSGHRGLDRIRSRALRGADLSALRSVHGRKNLEQSLRPEVLRAPAPAPQRRTGSPAQDRAGPASSRRASCRAIPMSFTKCLM